MCFSLENFLWPAFKLSLLDESIKKILNLWFVFFISSISIRLFYIFHLCRNSLSTMYHECCSPFLLGSFFLGVGGLGKFIVIQIFCTRRNVAIGLGFMEKIFEMQVCTCCSVYIWGHALPSFSTAAALVQCWAHLAPPIGWQKQQLFLQKVPLQSMDLKKPVQVQDSLLGQEQLKSISSRGEAGGPKQEVKRHLC